MTTDRHALHRVISTRSRLVTASARLQRLSVRGLLLDVALRDVAAKLRAGP